MDDSVSEPNEWTAKISPLREEMKEMMRAVVVLRNDNKVTAMESSSFAKAFNDVTRRAGIGMKPEDNALTFAVFRQAIHEERKTIAELRPDLAEEFNRLSPPRQQRSLDSAGVGGCMNGAVSEPNEWTEKIVQLRDEMKEILNAVALLWNDKKITSMESNEFYKAFNDVNRRAGIGMTPEDNAVTYAVFRQAIQEERKKIADLRPDLVDEFNRHAPPRHQRSLD